MRLKSQDWKDNAVTVSIGLDVSFASTAIYVPGPQGKVVLELQAASQPKALVRMVGSLPYTIDAIGFETGPLWLSKGIEEAGLDVVFMETWLVKAALKAMPIKTGRRCVRDIARLFQMRWYGTVHRKSLSSRELQSDAWARHPDEV